MITFDVSNVPNRKIAQMRSVLFEELGPFRA